MAAKQKEVLKWLGDIFGDSDVPKFERNEANINELHQLMIAYNASFDDLGKVNEYFSSKINLFANESENLHDYLKSLDVLPNSLDVEEQNCLDSLGYLYHTLNLGTCSSSNVIIALNSLEAQESKLKESLNKERKFTENLLKLSNNISKNLDDLKKISAEAETEAHSREDELNKEERKCNFNKEKLKKYQVDVRAYEKELNNNGFDENISLRSISNDVQELSKNKRELEDKQKTIDAYTLPPDMALAEVRVEELRQILSETMNNIAQSYAK